MLTEPFALGNSWIHRLDPRIRFVTACFYTSALALSRDLGVLTAAVAVSFVLLLLARLPGRKVLQRMVLVNTFVVFLWLVLPLTFQGPVAFCIGGMNVYHPGIVMAAQITLKSNAILMALIALIATLDFATLGWALDRLQVPDKVVYLLLMTYRYVFVLEQEYRKIVRAVRIRGFRPGTNVHTYKTYAYLIGMLLVRSIQRADRVYKAMLCRGFKRRFYCLRQYSAGRTEWLFFSVMGAVTLVLMGAEWLQFPPMP